MKFSVATVVGATRLSLTVIHLMTVTVAGVSHGDNCIASDICEDPTTSCIPDKSGDNRCLCNDSTFFSPDNKTCLSLDLLKVWNITFESTTRNVNLSWEFDKHGADVDQILRLNSDGPEKRIPEGMTTVSDLTPGQLYTMSIISSLQSTVYYHGRNISTSIPPIWMKPAKPGHLINVELLDQLPLLVYNISFGASIGLVDHYRIVVDRKTWDSSDSSPTIIVNDLTPGSSFDYVLIAYNGNNEPSDVTQGMLNTQVVAANDVNSVRVISQRKAASNWINLKVSWIPGNFTGSTKYSIRVEQEIQSQQAEFMPFANYTANGYTTTNVTVENVLAFRRYRVSVMAITDAGGSKWSSPVVVRSAPNYPGQVQHFSIQLDAIEAQEANIFIICPKEDERNGTLTGYVIRKTLQTSDIAESPKNYSVSLIPASQCHDTYTASDVGGITVSRSYSFEVSVMNTDFNGTFSDKIDLYVQPRAPRLEQTLKIYGVEAFVRNLENPQLHPTTIEALVCASCLMDARQGKVENVGLLVCKVGSDSQCDVEGWKNMSFTNIDDFGTWSSAKGADFKEGYRATSDVFMHSLNDQDAHHFFTLGADKNCDHLPNTTYCNGPLPPDSIFRIAAFKCNALGCDVRVSDDIFSTSHESGGSDDSDDRLGLKIGLPIAGVIGLGLIIMGIIYAIRNKKCGCRGQ